MEVIVKLVLLICGILVLVSCDDIAEDASLNTIGLIRKYGYNAEDHRVVTSDEYVLGVHRIAGGPLSPPARGKPVAFLQHGMLSSSADYVLMGPQVSLGYMLSDLGYDVWMGNARGNRYSNTHLTKDNATEDYWDFSWHEVGIYDLPAMIDYVLRETGQQRLHYIGHSQGTTAYFVLISELPNYGDKILSSQLLAPAAYMHNVKSPYVIWLATYLYSVEDMYQKSGTHYFAPTNEMDIAGGLEDCKDGAPNQDMCTMTIFLIAGFNSQEMNMTMLPVIKGHSPAGASVKQMLHHAQSVRSWIFRQYDFGNLNYYRYGQLVPPNYRFKGHTAPLAFYHSANDWMATPNDVNLLASQVNNIQLKYLVPQMAFNHMDFVWAINVRSLVYNRLVEDMAKWNLARG